MTSTPAIGRDWIWRCPADEGWFPWLMVNGQITSKGKRVDYGKTDAAIRPIALPDWAAALLRRRKVVQAPNDLDAVFITRNGT